MGLGWKNTWFTLCIAGSLSAGELNIQFVNDELINGPSPEGTADFDHLAKLGVKTIISVDGSLPDIAEAVKHGMRYVHLPIGYDGVSDKQARRLVRAVRDLPKPIYMHCHHGKHRSPTAAGLVMVGLGKQTPDEAVAFMQKVGTSKNYPGLYRCVMEAKPIPGIELDAVSADFPEQTVPTGMVALMVAIDHSFDRLKQAKENAWRPTADHPDVDPVHEAEILHGFLAKLQETEPDMMGKDPAEFVSKAKSADQLSREFAEAMRAAAADRSERFDALDKNCRSCHSIYRDVK